MRSSFFLALMLIIILDVNSQFSNFFEFKSENTLSNPQNSELIIDDTVLYGVTCYGGRYDYGTIFKIDYTGENLQILFDFDGTENGSYPKGSLIESGDTLFGTAANGGAAESGIIFRILKDGSGFKKILVFDGINKGAVPKGNLTLVNNTIYGTTKYGGTIGSRGVIYKINTDGTGFKKLLDFDGVKGAEPNGSLIYYDNVLYGMTYYGGTSYKGVVFKINSDGTDFKKFLDFDEINNGSNPYGGLTLLNNILYGETSYGGAFNKGNIFGINIDGTGFHTLYSFSNENDGLSPEGKLIVVDDSLFGMTLHGGINMSKGTIFKININGTGYKKIFDFENSEMNGMYPSGALIYSGSSLYGMTSNGGLGNKGVIFKINKDGQGFNKIFDMNLSPEGSEPSGSLLLSENNIFGTTKTGGNNNLGVIYKINTIDISYNKIFDFDGLNSGIKPNGSLVLFNDTLYGMTQYGGLNNSGVIYKIKQDGTGFTKLFDFSYETGHYPSGFLTISGDYLYGMTQSGGIGKGVLFKINKDGSNFQKLIEFGNGNKGSTPFGSLIISDSVIYGMTKMGGINNFGDIFKIKVDGTGYVKLLDFDYAYPDGTLMISGNILYGVSPVGGSLGYIFKIDIDGNNYTKLYGFIGTNPGINPIESMVINADLLYGITSKGGTNDEGILYRINKDGRSYQRLFDFNSKSNGATPNGALSMTGDTLYGVTKYGGQSNKGLIYKYVIQNYSEASYLQFSNINVTQFDVSFIIGKGNYRAAFISKDTVGIPKLIDGTNYESNIKFGFGSQTENGWYCIANGELLDNNFTITGLEANTYYRVMVAEYTIDSTGNAKYDTLPSVENPANQKTSSKLNQIINFNPLLIVTYGNVLFDSIAFPLKANSGLPVKYTSSNETVASFQEASINIVGAGETFITATQDGNDIYYAANSITQLLKVNKALLSVTVDNKTKFEGEPNPKFTCQYNGWVGLDKIDSLDIKPEMNCLADNYSPSGKYAIDIEGGFDNNYLFDYYSGNLDIIAKANVSDYNNDEFSIYPIPIRNLLHIDYKFNGECNFSIIDNNNKTILNGKLNHSLSSINLQGLPKGIYFLKVNNNEKVIIRKLIID